MLMVLDHTICILLQIFLIMQEVSFRTSVTRDHSLNVSYSNYNVRSESTFTKKSGVTFLTILKQCNVSILFSYLKAVSL